MASGAVLTYDLSTNNDNAIMRIDYSKSMKRIPLKLSLARSSVNLHVILERSFGVVYTDRFDSVILALHFIYSFISVSYFSLNGSFTFRCIFDGLFQAG